MIFPLASVRTPNVEGVATARTGEVPSAPGAPFCASTLGVAHSPVAIVSVVLSWTSVQTVYMLRYGRLYYSDPEGGIDFSGEAPDYLDLAYLAFTIGMCFQVSDTTLTAKPVRRLALHHALQSYVFGTVIVAVTINIVAGLIGT